MSRDTVVRPARVEDAEAIHELIHELARFDGSETELRMTPETIRRHCFGETPDFEVVVAERDGALLGCVTFFRRFHPWWARPVLQIDDLIVREAARGAGIGRQLMLAVARIVVAADTPLRWEVESDNAPARALYRGLGAVLHGKTVCRWSVAAMRAAIADGKTAA